MQHGQLCVGERVENALVVGACVFLVVLDGTKFALGVEDADKRAGCSDFLGVVNVVDRRFRDGFEGAVPSVGITLLKLVKGLDVRGIGVVGLLFVCKLRLRLKQDHGRHVWAVKCVDEVCVPVESIANAANRSQLIGIG